MADRVLVAGSRNRKKVVELSSLLDLPQFELWTLARFTDVPEVIEDGDSFVANATKKAVVLSQALGRWVLGEDSGLVVDALDGMPGIYSARYAGEPCNDQRNNEKLLAELAEVPDQQRTAHYVCVGVVADPSGTVRIQVEGRCDGLIARQARGNGGFGYDPLFLVPEQSRTFGELSGDFKRTHSHRAAAMRQLRPQLLELINTGKWS